MDEAAADGDKLELPTPPIANLVEDSIASRTKEITKRAKRERSPPVQLPLPAPKIRKAKEVAPKLPDKTKWTLEEQKQFFSALRIYGKNFDALGQFFNTRRRHANPEAQKRTFGQIRCFYYRSFRTVSKLYAFTEEEKATVDSLELRSVLAYLCLKPKVKCFDKKPTITVLHQLIRNGNAFLRVKGQREHFSIIGKALKPPKIANGSNSAKPSDRTSSKHVKIILNPASSSAYMRVALSCRYPHVEVSVSRATTITDLLDKLSQYWQLHTHAQCFLRDDSSTEQLILYPAVSTPDSPEIAAEKLTRPRSDSDQSIEPIADTLTGSKGNLARTAMLSAAKRMASNPNPDGLGFTLVDGMDDEADSSAGVFKPRLDGIDFTDEFGSEDEVEPETNPSTSTPLSATTTTSSILTLSDLAQGLSRTNSSTSTLTIGALHTLLQRPKELRLIYDFQNASRTAPSEPSSAYLHYVIQIANQCLTSLAERQTQTESKATKKITGKKQHTVRSKCYCSCCAHHQLGSKDQRRSSVKSAISPCADASTAPPVPTLPLVVPESATEDILTVQTSFSTSLNLTADAEAHRSQASFPKRDEKSDMFDALTWSTNAVAAPSEQSQVPPPPTSTTELPPVHTLLLPMSNAVEPKPAAIIFSRSNGVIDDPLIQSLAAEQAASANKYDLLSYRHKRVRRPLRYGDQSTRSSNTQLLLDANQRPAAPAVAPTPPAPPNISFHTGCEIQSDLLNENSNMSGVSLSTTIVNAALQTNPSRLRLDWPDNMSDLSFGSFPDLLDSNLSAGELTCFEQSTSTEQSKRAPDNSISDALFTINTTTNLLSQN